MAQSDWMDYVAFMSTRVKVATSDKRFDVAEECGHMLELIEKKGPGGLNKPIMGLLLMRRWTLAELAKATGMTRYDLTEAVMREETSSGIKQKLLEVVKRGSPH